MNDQESHGLRVTPLAADLLYNKDKVEVAADRLRHELKDPEKALSDIQEANKVLVFEDNLHVQVQFGHVEIVDHDNHVVSGGDVGDLKYPKAKEAPSNSAVPFGMSPNDPRFAARLVFDQSFKGVNADPIQPVTTPDFEGPPYVVPVPASHDGNPYNALKPPADPMLEGAFPIQPPAPPSERDVSVPPDVPTTTPDLVVRTHPNHPDINLDIRLGGKAGIDIHSGGFEHGRKLNDVDALAEALYRGHTDTAKATIQRIEHDPLVLQKLSATEQKVNVLAREQGFPAKEHVVWNQFGEIDITDNKRHPMVRVRKGSAPDDTVPVTPAVSRTAPELVVTAQPSPTLHQGMNLDLRLGKTGAGIDIHSGRFSADLNIGHVRKLNEVDKLAEALYHGDTNTAKAAAQRIARDQIPLQELREADYKANVLAHEHGFVRAPEQAVLNRFGQIEIVDSNGIPVPGADSIHIQPFNPLRRLRF